MKVQVGQRGVAFFWPDGSGWIVWHMFGNRQEFDQLDSWVANWI